MAVLHFTLKELRYRNALCEKYNLCFISLHPLNEQGVEVLHGGLNETVLVLPKYMVIQ